MADFHDINGSGGGGKGGGGSSFYEAENTLKSLVTARSLRLIGEGRIGGVVGGKKGVYIDNTPLQNADGTDNFAGVIFDQREGFPSQERMSGFPLAASESVVGVSVTNAAPVTRTTSAADIDAVAVTIGLPQGLVNQETTSNSVKGTQVQIAIDRKLTTAGAGSWEQVVSKTFDGKTLSAYEESFRVARPAGTGSWDIRVRRITADNGTATLKNATAWNRMTEYREVIAGFTGEYPNYAYVGVAIDATSATSSQIPKLSFLVDGLYIMVPSNYNPSNRVYTGQWDGSFKVAWSDNPAWVLYDLITNSRYGLGEYISRDMVDKYSFYNAAVYCDQLVSDGKGGTEPRFTYNGTINSRQDGLSHLQTVASSMMAKVVWVGGLVTVIQDRPSSPVCLITRDNVVNGEFSYKGSSFQERVTAVNVKWNDPSEKYLTRVTPVEASQADFDRYGYNEVNIDAVGCTRAGQALRVGKWYLDTVLNQVETVTFTMSYEGFGLMVNDVIKLFDEQRAGQALAGRLVSGSTTTVLQLDRPVTLASGSTVDVMLPSGVVETKAITETGTVSSVTLTTALSQTPAEYAEFVITTTSLSPRQFRITKVSLKDQNLVAVEAVTYDPNKYSRVETGLSIPAPVFSVVTEQVVGAPTAVVFRETAKNEDNTIIRSLVVSWTRPVTGTISSYRLQYQIDSSGWQTVTPEHTTFELRNVVVGAYQFRIQALGSNGVYSTPTTASYTISAIGGGSTTLLAPTTLVEQIGGGTTFTGQDLYVVWTNPAGNAGNSATLRDFQVTVKTTSDAVLRTEYIAPVAAGSTQTYSYSWAMNNQDGGPRRSVKIEVRARDTNNNLTSAVVNTFANPAPAVPSNVVASGGLGAVFLNWDKSTDKDYIGTNVWLSTTSGFTPSAATLVAEGASDFYAQTGLNAATTYYVKLAQYDAFGSSQDGTGLNVSPQYSITTAAGAGIPKGSALPGSGTEGDLYFNTTDGKVYRFHGGAWTALVPTSDLSGQITSAQLTDGAINTAKFAAGIAAVEIVGTLPSAGNFVGRQAYLTTDNKLYRYNGTAWVSSVAATDLVGQVVASQVADGAINTAKFAAGIAPVEIVATLPATGNFSGRQAFLTTDNKLYRYDGAAWVKSVDGGDLIANSIVAGKIAAGAISATEISASAITTAKIAAGAVTANEIAANTITAGQIATDTITSAQIAAGAITASELAANSVVAGKIAAGAISATEIAAGAITASKLAVTGQGKAINDDPNFGDATAWYSNSGSYTLVTEATSPVGRTVVRATGPTRVLGQRKAPVTAGTTYKVSVWARQTTTDGKMYLRLYCYDQNSVLVNYVVTGLSPVSGSLEAITLPSAWTKYVGYIVAGAGVIEATPVLHLNWSGTAAGVSDATDLRFEEYIGADLIVDGSIQARHIASEVITADKIAANAITSSELAANSVVAGKVAASTIGAAEIIASSITGDRLVANTITGDRIAANTITASNIDSRGLSIKDASGNIILAAGSALNVSNISGLGTLATQNSAVFGSTISGQITAATASTYIANLAVGTLQIANQAVTIPVSAYTEAQLTTSGGGTMNAQSCAITSTGAPVNVLAGMNILTGLTNQSYNITINVVRDSTVIYTTVIKTMTVSTSYSTNIIATLPPIYDVPGAGAHTYYLQINNPGNGGVSCRSVLLLEVKK
jgi:predicted phage tail protein